jgi:hypothetical protein
MTIFTSIYLFGPAGRSAESPTSGGGRVRRLVARRRLTRQACAGHRGALVTLAAQAAGAGVPELLVVVARVAVAKHMLAEVCRAEPDPAPTSSPAPRIETTARRGWL